MNITEDKRVYEPAPKLTKPEWRPRSVAQWCVITSLLLLITNCAAFRGGPERSSNPEVDLKAYEIYFSTELIDAYDNAPDETAKRAKRNKIVNGRLAAIDLRFNLFQQELFREGVGLNIGVDTLTISLGAAGALSSGGTSQILSGVSGGVVGLKQSIDKNAFFERTMPALLAEMIAQRKMVLVSIFDGLSQDTSTYPLTKGLLNLEEYYQAGTITGAVTNIVRASGEKAARADVLIYPERNKDHFAESVQKRVDTILTSIDSMTGAEAIALARAVPLTTQELERNTDLAERSACSFADETGASAKKLLRYRVIMGPRTASNLESWEKQIMKITGGG